jgi:hypothetical protein
MPATRNADLKRLAQHVTDALPVDIAEEVVLTGSVSRGMADAVSDIEMLVITPQALELEECFAFVRSAGLDKLGSWGPQEGPTRRVSGYRERVPLELIWWPSAFAETQIDALFAGALPATADALVHGVALRTTGRLSAWQQRLRAYPPELAFAQIENAALPWGGFAAAGLLTLIRPGDRLALTEWVVDGANRVLTIVYALNGVWRPTTKRLAVRVAPLGVKPSRLAERIDDALAESDPRRALRVMTELQLDAVTLAPSGPNVDRARNWLAEGLNILR